MELAQGVNRLSTLRQGLRDRMLGSALCDAPAFVRQLEDVYHDLWQQWCQGKRGPPVAEDAEEQGHQT